MLAPQVQWQVIEGYSVCITHNCRPFDHIDELPHVSRPGVIEEQPLGIVWYSYKPAWVFLDIEKKILDKDKDTLPPLP